MRPHAPLNLGAARQARDDDIVNDRIVGALFPLLARSRDEARVRKEANPLDYMPQLSIRIHCLDDTVDMSQG